MEAYDGMADLALRGRRLHREPTGLWGLLMQQCHAQLLHQLHHSMRLQVRSTFCAEIRKRRRRRLHRSSCSCCCSSSADAAAAAAAAAASSCLHNSSFTLSLWFLVFCSFPSSLLRDDFSLSWCLKEREWKVEREWKLERERQRMMRIVFFFYTGGII